MLATPETSRTPELIEMIDVDDQPVRLQRRHHGTGRGEEEAVVDDQQQQHRRHHERQVLAVLRRPQCDEPADQTRDHRQ